ncbi:lag1 longevity assurance [Stylonychia lemnae]|uniref:Lag1 longevity assurance n=1 Tax=Stylonychia lemnae TaxID=5949 RepID=A0A078A375_STYLE|nr:lag1 longevity assurance [Stylonychia lemnae]|eukprot:CDW76728.1 lag1 longevity assurance [Stylonychia lemnae]
MSTATKGQLKPNSANGAATVKEVISQKSQFTFLMIGIVAIIGTIRFIMEYGSIINWMQTNFQEPSYGWPSFKDFYITLIFGVFSVIANSIINMFTYKMFYNVCKEKNNEDIRVSKTIKSCNSLYKSIYFILVTIWGYQTLKDEPYLPKELFGKGHLQFINDNYPVQVWPVGLRCYYLGTMGYHVHQLFAHALHPIRNDFIEMFLHHVVTLTLYGGSYLINETAAGSVIMFLHDWADIFTSLVRCFTETTLVTCSVVSAIGMTVSWFYTRIYVFPMTIYYSCFDRDIYHGAKFYGDKYFGSLLIILYILHVYWFFVLLKSIHRFTKLGKTDDLQQRVEAKKTQ